MDTESKPDEESPSTPVPMADADQNIGKAKKYLFYSI